MRTVSIDELKRNLASIIDEAAAGERVLITRHRRPVASLTRAGLENVHVGRRARRGALRPFLKGATRGAYLHALVEDRRPTTGRAT